MTLRARPHWLLLAAIAAATPAYARDATQLESARKYLFHQCVAQGYASGPAHDDAARIAFVYLSAATQLDEAAQTKIEALIARATPARPAGMDQSNWALDRCYDLAQAAGTTRILKRLVR